MLTPSAGMRRRSPHRGGMSGAAGAVVSHGGVIRLVLAAFLGLDLSGIWRLGQDSAAINRLDFMAEGRVVLRQMNVTPEERF